MSKGRGRGRARIHDEVAETLRAMAYLNDDDLARMVSRLKKQAAAANSILANASRELRARRRRKSAAPQPAQADIFAAGQQ